MDGTSPMVRPPCAALAKVGLAVEQATSDVAPYVFLPKTWEKYLQSLSGARRGIASHPARFRQMGRR